MPAECGLIPRCSNCPSKASSALFDPTAKTITIRVTATVSFTLCALVPLMIRDPIPR